MTSPVLQVKRGALSNLPGLRAGEPAFTTDSFDFFVGIDSTTNNNKFLGSYRYWTKETTTVGSSVKLVEGTNNGANFVALKAPDNIAADLTYTLPGTQGSVNSVLTNDGTGVLTWGSGSANPIFTGIATFNTTQVYINSYLKVTGITSFTDTTDSTTSTNGSVQIAGGLGVAKSVNIGGNLSVTGVSTFTGALTVNGAATFNSTITGTISTATRATTIDTTATSTAASFYPTFVSSSASATGATLRVDADITYNPSTNALTVPTINTSSIKASDGTNAITVSNTTGAVGFANSVTVNGDFYVIGTTTQVETTNLKVQDNLIDLGLTQSGGVLVPPGSNLGIDLGLLLNWYSASAKKAAVYWKNSTSRITLASDVTEAAGVLTAATYADVEIGSLWMNDTAGQNAVASYLSANSLYSGSAAGRYLQNITVDAGTF